MLLQLFGKRRKFNDRDIDNKLSVIFRKTFQADDLEKFSKLKYGDDLWDRRRHKKLLINIEKVFSICIDSNHRELCQNYLLILNVVKAVLKNDSRHI